MELALLGGKALRETPFTPWPVFDEAEERALLGVLRSGNWWRYSMGEATDSGATQSSDSKVAEFQSAFARAHGAKFGIACSTGMAAIEVVMKSLGIGSGDEVIVPPYTFIATATAPMVVGATPVFVDIEADTYNLDPKRLEEAITPRTKAIMPVHFAGMAADMDGILAVANRHGIPVVEDAAHAHGGCWKDRGLGTIGAAGTFSFQASKNMTSGEGGLIVTDSAKIAELCESHVWVGRKVGRPWYEHHRLGWNYRLTEFQAAILIEQLKRLAAQTARRMDNGRYLAELLAGIPGIETLRVPDYATRHTYHIFVLRFHEAEFGVKRGNFLAALNAEGIPASAGYAFPLYRNPLFENPPSGGNYQRFADLCPNAEAACHEAIWLEHRLLLGDREDMEQIAAAVQKIHKFRNEFDDAARVFASRR